MENNELAKRLRDAIGRIGNDDAKLTPLIINKTYDIGLVSTTAIMASGLFDEKAFERVLNDSQQNLVDSFIPHGHDGVEVISTLSQEHGFVFVNSVWIDADGVLLFRVTHKVLINDVKAEQADGEE